MAPLEQKGFLGKSMEGWVQKIRAQHKQLFTLADEVNELCHTSMFELEPHNRDIHEMLVATLYLRVVSNYQGTVLLLERGMMPEARVLARAMLEAIFSLVAIGNKPPLAHDYVYEDRNSRLKFLQKFKQLHGGKLPEGISEPEIQSLKKELKDDINTNQRKVRNTEEWAREADHLHTVWTLPEGDADYPLRWSLIKAGFSRHMTKTELRYPSRLNKGERGIWQRRYWEHMIRDEHDYGKHVDYIHYNPVKHGYATHAAEWLYSSIHRYVAAGTLTRDWGAGEPEESGQFGER